MDSIPFDYREQHPSLFNRPKKDNPNEMQRTNPSQRGREPGVNDDLVYGKTRCTGDDDK